MRNKDNFIFIFLPLFCRCKFKGWDRHINTTARLRTDLFICTKEETLSRIHLSFSVDTYATVTSIPLMTFFQAVNALSWSSAAFRAVVRFICCRDSRNPDSYPYRVFPEYISIRPSGNSLWNWSYNADSWGMFSVFGCNSFIPLVTR